MTHHDFNFVEVQYELVNRVKGGGFRVMSRYKSKQLGSADFYQLCLRDVGISMVVTSSRAFM